MPLVGIQVDDREGRVRESADRGAARLIHEKRADEPVTGTMTKDSPEEALSPNREEMFSKLFSN